MGWCKYVQITWATRCGTAVSHEDSSAASARYSLPAYYNWGGKQLSLRCLRHSFGHSGLSPGGSCGGEGGQVKGGTMLCA